MQWPKACGRALRPRRRRATRDATPEASAIVAVIEIISPIFGIVLIGWLAARLRAFDDAATRGLSLFAFNFAIPVMLARTIAQAELPEQPDWALILAYFTGAFAVFGLAALAARLLGRKGAEPAIFGINAAFSNTIILGIPLVLKSFGQAAAVPLSLILAFHSAALFSLTTVVAELGAGAGVPPREVLRNVGRGLVHNPILWGIAVGLTLNALDLGLPAVADQLAATLGAAALPSALFALGANLSRFRLARTVREALLLSAFKTVLQPVIVYFLGARVFALPDPTLAVLVTIAALPTGVNGYLFAARYDAAVPEASSTILLSTVISVVTLSVLLVALRV